MKLVYSLILATMISGCTKTVYIHDCPQLPTISIPESQDAPVRIKYEVVK